MILQASSDYFRALFQSGMTENKDNVVKFNYNENSIQLIIDFIYTGKIELDDKNIIDVTEIAHYLQVYMYTIIYIYI